MHGVCDDDDDDDVDGDGDDDVLIKHGAMLCGYTSGVELFAVPYVQVHTLYILHLYGYGYILPCDSKPNKPRKTLTRKATDHYIVFYVRSSPYANPRRSSNTYP